MAWTVTFTENGIQMMSQLAAGAVLNLTKVETGEGTAQDLYHATSVSSPITTGAMTRMVESDGVVVKIRIYSHTNAYVMKQIGIFGKVDNGQERLFALMQNPGGIEILSKDDFPDFAFNVSLFIKSNNTDNISVTVNPSALVTAAQLAEATAHVINIVRKYYTTSSSVSCPCVEGNNKTYIVWCSSSSGNGIMDDTYGGLFLVSNGKYATIKQGSNISASVQEGNLIVSSTTSVPMAVIEL